MISELILELSRKCNSKCITCNLWKLESPPSLSLDAIKSLLRAECLKDLYNLYLAGGEPTQVKELFIDTALFFHELHPKGIVTSTMNGLDTESTIEVTQRLKDANVPIMWQFSLNGKKATHDWSRGIEGAFEKTVETIRRIAEMGVAFNISYLRTSKATEEDDNFIRDFADQYKIGIERVDNILSGKRYDTPSKNQGLWRFNCPALKKLFVINSLGEVRACEKDNDFLTLGNINDKSLDQIMAEKKQEVESLIEQGVCQPCDLICFYNKRL